MDSRLLFLHGIGGAEPLDDWLPALNNALAAAGYTVLAPSEVINPDYGDLLDGDAPDEGADCPVTLTGRPADGDAVSEYFDRVRRFQADVGAQPPADSWISYAPTELAELGAEVMGRVERYKNDPAVRRAVWRAVLADLPQRGRIVVVGHSLGSVVAADLIARIPAGLVVDALITVASPLGFVQGLRARSKHLASVRDFPYERVRMWVNLYSPLDAVTGGRGIAREYPNALDVMVHTGQSGLLGRHGLDAHMFTQPLGKAVGAGLWGQPRPEPDGSLPAERYGPHWIPILAAFGYAQTLDAALEGKDPKRRLSLRLAREECARREEALARRAAERFAEEPGPLADQYRRYPAAAQLVDNALGLAARQIPDDDLMSYAIALLHGLPLPPFEVEAGDRGGVRREALRVFIERVRLPGSSGPDSEGLAAAAVECLDQAEEYMGNKSGAWVKWVLVGTAGAALIVGTVVTAGAMAPAGLAGAAATTAALAAFGPGGMAGGVAAIAALTSVGAAAVGVSGIAALSEGAEEAQRTRLRRRANIRAAIADLAVGAEPEQLRSSLSAFLAVVMLQERFEHPSNRRDIGLAVHTALDVISSDAALSARINAGSPHTKALQAKQRHLRKALDWLAPEEEPAQLLALGHVPISGPRQIEGPMR